MHNGEGDIEQVNKELCATIDFSLQNGIKKEQIIVDPGIGFGKTNEQSINIIKNTDVETTPYKFEKVILTDCIINSKKHGLLPLRILIINQYIINPAKISAINIMTLFIVCRWDEWCRGCHYYVYQMELER